MQCSIKHHSLTHTLVKKKNSFTYRDAHLQGEKKRLHKNKKAKPRGIKQCEGSMERRLRKLKTDSGY